MKLSCYLSAASALLLFGSTHAEAGCGQAGSVITNLPPIPGSGYQVYGLNATGQLTGWFYIALQHPPHAFFYDSGALTDLGTFGGSDSIGYAINSSGQVAGQSDLDSVQSHAFLYSGSGKPLDLGTLGGVATSTAAAINDAGVVVGSSPTNDGSSMAFMYVNGTMAPLGTLGGNSSSAFVINNANVIGGESSISSGDTHGFVYSAGVMTDVGTLGGNYSTVLALNDAGIAVGYSIRADGTPHGFAYTDTLIDLGTLGGPVSFASGINVSNQVIGVAMTPAGEIHGFIYTDGTMTDLGTFGGGFSYADAINNLGQVVGESGTPAGVSHAFLWQKGQLLDLNTVLPANSGWELNAAYFINDAGRIVGIGSLDGLSQWFIMDLTTGNKAPVAVAGPNQIVDCATPVTLNGSASSAPGNDTLTFQWSLSGTVLGTDPILSVSLPLGTNVVTLVVTDPCGATGQTNVTVVVTDTTAPVVAGPAPLTLSADANCQAVVPDVTSKVVATDNCTPAGQLVLSQNPAAGTIVGSGQYTIVVSAKDLAGNVGSASVTLNVVDTTAPTIVQLPNPVTLSADSTCQALVPNLLPNVVATDNCTGPDKLLLSQDPVAGTIVGTGQYSVKIYVKDAAGNVASGSVTLTVVDATAPVIQTVTVNPSVLTPPNHSLIPVTVSVAAVDNCDPAPVSKIVSITANGPVAPGEIQITGPLTATLAASKNTSGSTRIYTITVSTTDASGNVAFGTCYVTVPNSNGGGNGTGNKMMPF